MEVLEITVTAQPSVLSGFLDLIQNGSAEIVSSAQDSPAMRGVGFDHD
jgi:hypothetical protein